jgi:hypothetical protein
MMAGYCLKNKVGAHVLAAALAAVVVGVPLAESASADEFEYDSSHCTPDAKGFVYLEIGREVFRWPQEELTVIGDLPPELKAAAPQPPDPDEPEGCPGHPIQGRSFSFAYSYKAILENTANPTYPPGAPSLLRLFSVTEDYWGLQPSTEQAFHSTCDRWQIRVQLPEGLTGCKVPTTDSQIPPEEWATYYEASSTEYTAPFGRPFIVSCHGAVRIMLCNVRYKLLPTVNMRYEFELRRIPIEQIISYDRSLRDRVFSALVRDHSWTSPDSQPHQVK